MSDEHRPFVPKTATDFQRIKLERLMANPHKPVIIPETPKEKKGLSVPEFVRNVMGSSAGAGSGEFHVYRHLRRKEYTRQKAIEEKGEKEKLDEDFCKRLEENKRKMEERTAKKRAKRLKKKQKQKREKGNNKKLPKIKKSSSEDESSEKSNQSDVNSDKESENYSASETKHVTGESCVDKIDKEKSC